MHEIADLCHCFVSNEAEFVARERDYNALAALMFVALLLYVVLSY